MVRYHLYPKVQLELGLNLRLVLAMKSNTINGQRDVHILRSSSEEVACAFCS